MAMIARKTIAIIGFVATIVGKMFILLVCPM
jgi:hypothetical protein